MIETVKKVKNGYLVNGGQMFVPEQPDNRHYQLIMSWVECGGVIEPEEEEVEA